MSFGNFLSASPNPIAMTSMSMLWSFLACVAANGWFDYTPSASVTTNRGPSTDFKRDMASSNGCAAFPPPTIPM